MGLKTNTKYEADAGTIHRIKVDSTRTSVIGTPPTGAIDSRVSAMQSRAKGEYGLKPRGVMLSRTVGTAPNSFKKFTFLPVLTETAFGGSTFNIGETITINSVAWTVESKLDETGK